MEHSRAMSFMLRAVWTIGAVVVTASVPAVGTGGGIQGDCAFAYRASSLVSGGGIEVQLLHGRFHIPAEISPHHYIESWDAILGERGHVLYRISSSGARPVLNLDSAFPVVTRQAARKYGLVDGYDLSPSGTQLAFYGWHDHEVRVFDLTTKRLRNISTVSAIARKAGIQSKSGLGYEQGIIWRPDESGLAITVPGNQFEDEQEATVRPVTIVYDLARKSARTIGEGLPVAWTSPSRILLLSGANRSEVKVFSTSGRLISQRHESRILGAGWTGRYVLLLLHPGPRKEGMSYQVRVLDGNLRPIATIPLPSGHGEIIHSFVGLPATAGLEDKMKGDLQRRFTSASAMGGH